MKTTFLQALLVSALTISLTACDLELDNSDENVDHPLTLIQSYDANTDLNQFQVLSGSTKVTYSTAPADSHYSQSQIYQNNDSNALFHVYDNGSKQYFYIEDNTLVKLDQITSIRDTFTSGQSIYAIATINSEYNFVTFNAQGVEVITTDINEREFVTQGDAYLFTQNDDEANSANIFSFNGEQLNTEKTITGSTISNLNAYPDTLMYKLDSTGNIQLDNLNTSREIDIASAYPLASKDGAYLVYNHDWGTPVYKFTANSSVPIAMNLHTPQPELTGTKTLFWAKTHYSNVNHGSIYQFDGDSATPVLSDINGSLIRYLSYNQTRIDNDLYVIATTEDGDQHILAIDENDDITVVKSLTISGSPTLINDEGQLHYSLREHQGNSLYEFNIYNLETELVKTVYKYLETET